MVIAISCSMKYRDVAKSVIENFDNIGVTALFPNLDYELGNNDHANTCQEKKRLATEHYLAISKSDAVYFITPGGYMGTSCKVELGYAVAKNKPIYFSEPTNDIGLDCYVKEFVPVDSVHRIIK